MMRRLAAEMGVHSVMFDFCRLGMTTGGADGMKGMAKKRTRVLTNSRHIARLLEHAQCSGDHEHVVLQGGRAAKCQVYTESFCTAIVEGLKREIADEQWVKNVYNALDATEEMQNLLTMQENLEKVVPPEEQLDLSEYKAMYEGMEFVDDVTGLQLDKDLAVKARRAEMTYFKQRGVYTKEPRRAGMKVISTRWLDVNKGDDIHRDYRSRLVGRELNLSKQPDLFAATPPLESLRVILSIAAGRQSSPSRRRRYIVMANDVKRAYFYAPATRAVFIEIPPEDFEDGDEGRVGRLNLSLYGTRDAAKNWAEHYTNVLRRNGFTVGRASPCNFYNEEREIALTVHGDDFTSCGPEDSLRWLDSVLQAEFELKTEFLGPDPARHVQEVRILNRVVRWEAEGLVYEPDQRHAEIVISELGLTDAKAVSTPGTREEAKRAEQEDPSEDGEPLNKADASAYRGVCARLNYLAQDRPELLYSAKEACRRMAKPCEGHWGLLKRIGRFLLGTPRVAQVFRWQSAAQLVEAFVDSDWAGCRRTLRSTSGGALTWGFHTLKAWSSTQAVLALSSAEAELYALVKGSSMVLGLMSLLRDLGQCVDGRVHCDSSAALGIVQRRGLGKLRHLNVQYLWLQERARERDLVIQKIAGEINPADLMTKHLDEGTLWRHLLRLDYFRLDGRATSAPNMQSVCEADWSPPRAGKLHGGADGHGLQHDDAMRARGEENMHWQVGDRIATMVHSDARMCLATPLRVSGAPPAKMLTSVRITEGAFCDTGEVFRRVDSWRARSIAHLSMGRPWCGRTTFLLFSDSTSEKCWLSAEERANLFSNETPSGHETSRDVVQRSELGVTSVGGSGFPDSPCLKLVGCAVSSPQGKVNEQF